MPNEFTISAAPSARVVTPGAQVAYRLEQMPNGPKPSTVTALWFAVNDESVVTWRRPKVIDGPSGPIWPDAKWAAPGHHRIVCRVTRSGKTTDYVYEQWVAPISDKLKGGPALPRSDADPVATLNTYRRYSDVIQAAAKQNPPKTDKDKAAHEAEIEGFENFCNKLEERLESTKNFVRHHIQAEHFEAQTQKRSPLRVFISRVESKKWLIVDWTNAAQRSATGEYAGFGDSADEALANALDDWGEDNRYPTGGITYKISGIDGVRDKSGNFETDGSAYWDSVSSFFSWIGLGAAVVAGVVTLVAPVPGSRVVSALIWTAIFSSTAAATINIGTRVEEGFSSWSANAIDVLSIAGNLFGAGAMVWSRGATVLAQNGTKFALVGAIASDGAQGVFLGIEYADRLKKIQDDPNIAPGERTRQIVALLGAALRDGVLIYISVKGSKADLDNLGGSLKNLADPKAEVDLSKNPSVSGKADGNVHTTKVQLDQEMQPPQALGAAAKRPDAPPPKTSGPQRTNNLDQLYRDAAVGQTQLNDLTNKLANQFGGEALIPPTLKGRARAQEKITADYSGDASQIVDLARSSIVFKSMKELDQATAALKSSAKIVREKDRFAKPMNGYRDRMYNLEMPNGHIVEIQLHLDAIMTIKNGRGHALYEQQRAIEAKSKAAGRKPTPAEDAEIETLGREMKKLYDQAFQSAQ